MIQLVETAWEFIGGDMMRQEASQQVPDMAAPTHISSPDGEVPSSCSRFQRAIEFVGRRWVGVIVYTLLDGPCRFNELLAKVPNISDRLLAERLRELEAAGMVTRDVQPGPPVRVVYDLTDAGRSFSEVVRVINAWAHEWMGNETEE